MSIVFFEDTSWKNFVPLSYTIFLFDLKIGSLTTFEHFNNKSSKFLTRQYLEKVTKERHPDNIVNKLEYNGDDIFINSLFIPLKSFFKKWSMKKKFLITFGDKILMGRIDKSDFEYLYESVVHAKKINSNRISTEMTDINNLDECVLIRWPWDCIFHIKQILTSQLRLKNKVPNGIKVIGNNPVYVDKTSIIGEGLSLMQAMEGSILVLSPQFINLQSMAQFMLENTVK